MYFSVLHLTSQGSKNLFCASRRNVSGAIFLVALSFILVAIVRQDSKVQAQKKEAIFEAIFCTHPDTNFINEMTASFLAMKIDEKQKKKRRRKKKKLLERSWAHFILMKP